MVVIVVKLLLLLLLSFALRCAKSRPRSKYAYLCQRNNKMIDIRDLIVINLLLYFA